MYGKECNYIQCKKTINWLNLAQSLNCRNYGIYDANCVNCNAQYVEQTKINFQLDGITNRHLEKI